MASGLRSSHRGPKRRSRHPAAGSSTFPSAAASGSSSRAPGTSPDEHGAAVPVPHGAPGLPGSPVPDGEAWRDQTLKDLGDLRVRQGAKSE